MDRPKLEDFDFSKVNNVSSSDKKDLLEGAAILLRVVEGAGVALYRHNPDSSAELLPTRRDLFQYEGGYTWGYKGTGVRNLAYAIAGRIYEFDQLNKEQLSGKAYLIVERVLSGLQKDTPADLDVMEIKRVCESE